MINSENAVVDGSLSLTITLGVTVLNNIFSVRSTNIENIKLHPNLAFKSLLLS